MVVYIAELHDIGKMIDKENLRKLGVNVKGHTFTNFDFNKYGMTKPSSPSWYAQYTDEVGSLTSTKVPKDYIADILLTNIADKLSASISRTWGKKGDVSKGVHVLWNPCYYQKEVSTGKKWAAFTTQDELKEMFDFIDNCNDHNEFFERYKDSLMLTPEDKSVPFDIVSLYTHLELTGKIYRILKKHSQAIEDNGKLYLEYLSKRVQTINEATGGRIDEPNQKGKWVFRLISCNIKFPQSFSRLQDLNILRKRSDLIKVFSKNVDTKDYVLFFTDDFVCLFIPKENEVRIQELLKPFLKAGFVIDYTEMKAELNLLTSSMKRAYSLSTTRHLKLYEKRASFDTSLEIPPNLCDSCQMKQGRERVVKDQVHEYLCDTCSEIRDMGDPASDYAEWEGKAAWMKITLDQELLLKAIHRMFEDYVDNHQKMNGVNSSDKNELKNSFRPLAVQMDFVKDYKLLLKDFNERVYEIKDNEGNPLFTEENFLYPIDGYYEFGIFKVYSGKDILKVLDLFYSLLKDYFPECLKDSPINLSLSIAQVKYPYLQHWRFLSMPRNIINIQSIGSAKLSMDTTQYKRLKEKIRVEDTKLSHFLHRLADIEIETKSNIIVMLEIFNKRKKFPALLELIRSGLSVRQILDFYKLSREVEIL